MAERRERHPQRLRRRGPGVLRDQRAVLRDRGPGVSLRRRGSARGAMADVGFHDDPWDLLAGTSDALSGLAALPRSGAVDFSDFILFDRPKIGNRSVLQKFIPRYPQVEGVEAIHKRAMDPSGAGPHLALPGHRQDPLDGVCGTSTPNDPSVGGPDRLDRARPARPDRADGTPVPDRRPAPPTCRGHEGRPSANAGRGSARHHRDHDLPVRGRGFLNDATNIIVLVDEAHRTQEGRLGHDLRMALPNAQFFGLTGTPISDEERNTFRLSATPTTRAGSSTATPSSARSPTAPRSRSIVETRLVDFHIDQAALDEAFAEMAEEERLTEEERELLADRAAHVRTIVRKPDRIERSAPTSSSTTSPRSRRSA